MVAGVRSGAGKMRAYWDDAARRNAVWYVDTSLDYEAPDMERFFETGRRIVSEALDQSPIFPPATGLAVEIGSGLGRVCGALAGRFDHVVGIDVSPEMVKRARKLVPDPRVRFEVGDGVTLAAVEDRSADLVLSFTVFQHIPEVPIIEGYLREAARVLVPGGLFVFQWNNEAGSLRWRLRRGLLGALQRTRVRPERHLRHAPEFLGSRVPVRRIERALEESDVELCATAQTGTLFAWAWAQRKG
jgi:SAM-dependent methyltransferase